MDFWQFLGDLHPKLVQFPLVLLLAGLSFDAVGLVARSSRCHFAGRALSVAGVFFLLLAFVCGIYAEIWAGRAGIPQQQIEWHELCANVASWGFVVLTAWRLLLTEDRRRALTVYTVAGLCWYGLLVATGYFGGRLVFQYGAGVVGGRANDVLTLHDLNVLATRQTDANLRYSELMHHTAGWLTLALTGAIAAGTLWPSRSEKLKWIGPLILLVGGVGLFFFADRDLYRLTDLRQLRDREVQLHKALAIILATLGAIGLYRLRRPGQPQAKRPRLVTPSKVVAVMALIGGGLLFTHVHTVAPYANVAAGVYIAHLVLGLVALGIGAARLLQDAAPRFQRAFGVAFVALLGFESLLLITYNEGLPWYIGYGRYQRWGASADGARDPGAPIAPYGPIRAQLDFDPRTQAVTVTVKDRFTEAPVAVPTKQIDLRVSRGYQESAVLLDADATGSRFTGRAPWLAGVMAFSARAELPVGGVPTMGYFDPWVTPAVHPIPPNEVARFQCPMHDGIVSEKAGVCSLCGMPLVPLRRVPSAALHDTDYDMRLEIGPSSPVAATPASLRFVPLHGGNVVRGLMVVHEHPMHLIVVSSDLAFYDHVHPTLQPDDSLALNYTFPRPGAYLLYADVTPTAQRAQVFRLPVAVAAAPTAGDPDPPAPTGAALVPSPSPSKPVDDEPSLTAELLFQPRTPVAGLETHFLVRLSKDGAPVNDLEPYLAAMAHAVFVSEDSTIFLHCHPELVTPPGPATRGGPDVPFATFFPRPGRYKLWVQFQRHGRVDVVSWVVDVGTTLLPARVVRFLLE
ncbi:MAG TPA: DUF2231 domain-containing protein [Polyangia bacterium]|nr:DUF2231 domain-containing protein [Polyangia bacterium]